jgi:plasmid stabilization system protein ParE
MTRYAISRAAKSDLDGIWDHVAQDAPLAADRLIGKLFDAFRHLSSTPLAGELCEHLRPGLRRFCMGNYVIYYKVARRMTVVRVLYGARDAGALFMTE